MCSLFGIVGEYNLNEAHKALDTLQHRGPDHCEVIKNKNLFFAHQRLSIHELSSPIQQPFIYENILLSFNGAIYNYKELRKELSAQYVFKSSLEAEVLLFAYIKWGVDFVHHLEGMFAIAIYDNETLLLFRDRFGKKPLFYLEDKSFYFASEIKALRPFLKNVEMDQDALMSYLSFLAPTPPYTFYKGIKKLAAGEYLIYKGSKLEVHRYYDLLHTQNKIIHSKDHAIALLEKELSDSIYKRLHTDVKVAALLSGGIDSATINAYISDAGRDIQTYSLGYKDFDKYDETQNASDTAKHLGVQNKQVFISEKDFLDASDSVFDSLDEPLNDPAAIPLYLLFKEIAKDGYKVVLSGEGSDEIFLGYRQYFEFLDIEKARELEHKNWLKNYFKANYSPNREWEHYKRVLNDSLLFRTSGENFTDLQKNNLLKRNVKDNQSLQYLKNYRETFKNSTYDDESLWYTYIDLNIFQAEHFLTKLDRVSMAHSIESRTPFLDHKLIEAIYTISPKLRYEDKTTKSLLKQIMQKRLGNAIISRKKKGFSNPYMEYIQNSKRLSLIEEVNQKTQLFKKEELHQFLSVSNSKKFKQHIWGLYILSLWMKKNLL